MLSVTDFIFLEFSVNEIVMLDFSTPFPYFEILYVVWRASGLFLFRR